jgi:hypothetical protein
MLSRKKQQQANGPVPSVGICGRSHVYALKQGSSRPEVYTFFSAAYDGCKECVKQALLVDKTVKASTLSDHGSFTAESWAEWGASEAGKDTVAVLDILARCRAMEALPNSSMESAAHVAGPVSGSLCGDGTAPEYCWVNVRVPKPCGKEHQLQWEQRLPEKGVNYEFLMAAHTGCKDCVMHFVEREGQDVNMASHGGLWTVLSWAKHGVVAGYDTGFVCNYLVRRGAREEVPSATGCQGSLWQVATAQEHGGGYTGTPTEEQYEAWYGPGRAMFKRMAGDSGIAEPGTRAPRLCDSVSELWGRSHGARKVSGKSDRRGLGCWGKGPLRCT